MKRVVKWIVGMLDDGKEISALEYVCLSIALVSLVVLPGIVLLTFLIYAEFVMESEKPLE